MNTFATDTGKAAGARYQMLGTVPTPVVGLSGMVIDTRVHNQLSRGFLIVNTTGTPGQFWPHNIRHPGIVSKPAPGNVKPKQTTTWYVPKPIINLILYCVQRDSRASR